MEALLGCEAHQTEGAHVNRARPPAFACVPAQSSKYPGIVQLLQQAVVPGLLGAAMGPYLALWQLVVFHASSKEHNGVV